MSHSYALVFFFFERFGISSVGFLARRNLLVRNFRVSPSRERRSIDTTGHCAQCAKPVIVDTCRKEKDFIDTLVELRNYGS